MSEPRYQIFHQVGDALEQIGATDDMTAANRMILAALVAGAPYARQLDTRPDEERPVAGPKLLVDAHANLVGL